MTQPYVRDAQLLKTLTVSFARGNVQNLMWPTPFLYKKFVEVYHNQESEDLQQLNVHYPTKFDIVCNHAIYTPSLEKLLNLENRNEFHFTILRHPLDLLKSSFKYFHDEVGPFKRAGSLQRFLLDPPRYFELENGTTGNKVYKPKAHQMDWAGKNAMAHDLGYYHWKQFLETKSSIKKFKQYLDKIYDVVLITEHMDYSLLILKKILNLSLDDVAYVTVNKNSQKDEIDKTETDKTKHDNTPYETMTNDQVLDQQNYNFKKWATIDYAIYEHYNKTFWQRVEQYNITENDIEELNTHRETIKNRCFRGTTTKLKGYKQEFKPWSPGNGQQKIMQYIFTETGADDEYCRSMIRPEVAFAQRLRALQGLPINAKHIITRYQQRNMSRVEIAEEMRLPGVNVSTFFR